MDEIDHEPKYIVPGISCPVTNEESRKQLTEINIDRMKAFLSPAEVILGRRVEKKALPESERKKKRDSRKRTKDSRRKNRKP